MNITLLVLHALGGFCDRHSEALELLGVAAILNMPKVGGVFYGWVRSTLQSWIGRTHPEQSQQIASTGGTITPETLQALIDALKASNPTPPPDPIQAHPNPEVRA